MMVTSLGSAAESNNDELITKMCSKGVPWTLPKVQAPFVLSEVYLRLNGDREPTMRVCHCTEDIDEKIMYVRFRSVDEFTAAPSENELQSSTSSNNLESGSLSVLRGRGCMDVQGRNIVILHYDKNIGRWGTYFSPIEAATTQSESSP